MTRIVVGVYIDGICAVLRGGQVTVEQHGQSSVEVPIIDGGDKIPVTKDQVRRCVQH